MTVISMVRRYAEYFIDFIYFKKLHTGQNQLIYLTDYNLSLEGDMKLIFMSFGLYYDTPFTYNI